MNVWDDSLRHEHVVQYPELQRVEDPEETRPVRAAAAAGEGGRGKTLPPGKALARCVCLFRTFILTWVLPKSGTCS